MLVACHERVQRSLDLMRRLQQHVIEKGIDADARQAARDVMRYFDQAAPLHHQDEELHVFPPLLQTADAQMQTVVQQLQQDHRAMETRWATARAVLLRLAGHDSSASLRLTPVQTAALDDFAALYGQHIALEEERVYPAARATLVPAALHAMSLDMMHRRGVR
jgi:hemerythrin-like domain-containing protein